jgi:hypothetical protein
MQAEPPPLYARRIIMRKMWIVAAGPRRLGSPVSVRAELVEALSFRLAKREGRPFERLRTNGFE